MRCVRWSNKPLCLGKAAAEEDGGREKGGSVGWVAWRRVWWWQPCPCHSPAVTVGRLCSGFSGDTHLLSAVPRPGRLPRREPLRVRPALRGGRENLLRYGLGCGGADTGAGQQVTACRWPRWGDNWLESQAAPQDTS